ncbi:alkyl hydroperoxide reductase [Leifsonia sp. Leaf325]|nr:alkyl hydroperoxide reductase [Leifsonia sp. Leaf325]
MTATIASLLLAVGLAGCASDDLANQYRAGSGKGYISGDGTITELPPTDRGDPIKFTGTTESGDTVDAADYVGQVVIVNFWYAGCAPCRAEAPDLEAVHQKYADEDVAFLGVNVRDQADTARAFAQTYGVTYPSIMDVPEAAAALAFAGDFAPNAVPTTLVLDRDGRVAGRILGQLSSRATLSALVDAVLGEPTE